MLYVFETIVELGNKVVKECYDLYNQVKVGKVLPNTVEDDTIIDKDGRSFPFECVEAINVTRNFSKNNFSADDLAKMTPEQIAELAAREDSYDFLVANKSGSMHLEKNWNEVDLKGTLVKVAGKYYPLEANRVYNNKLSAASKYLKGEELSWKEFRSLKARETFSMRIRKPALKMEIGDRSAVRTDDLDHFSQEMQIAATEKGFGKHGSDEDIAMGHIFKSNNEEGREAILRFDDYGLMQTCLEGCGHLKQGPKKEWKGKSVTERMHTYLEQLQRDATASKFADRGVNEATADNISQAQVLLDLEEALMQEERDTIRQTIRMKINKIRFDDEISDGCTKALRPSKFEESETFDGIITNEIKFDFVKLKGQLSVKEREMIQDEWEILDPNEKRDFTMLISIKPMVIGGKSWDLPVAVLQEYAKYENDNRGHEFQSLERDYSVENAVAEITA